MADRYRITSQQATSIRIPGGTFAEGVRISYVTKPSGIEGVVDVPQAQYTPEEVDRIIDALALNAESVHNL